MTTYTIRYLCNINAPKFVIGYRPEHEVVEAGVIEEITANDDLEACERAFMYWNRDDRPNGQTAPSLSVGDVVHLQYGINGEVDKYFACVDVGFEPITRPHEVALVGTPAQMMREHYERTQENS